MGARIEMIDLERLGSEIYFLRRTLQISQDSLSNDLCTQALISRIEKGKVLPNIEILFLLSKKLKVPLFKLVGSLLYEKYEYYSEVFLYLNQISFEQNYAEVFEISRAELKNPSLKSQDIINYLQKYYITSSFYLKKMDFQQTISKLENLQKSTHKYHYFVCQIILNDIANIYAFMKRYDESISLYDEILRMSDHSYEFTMLRIKTLTDQSAAYYHERKLKLALDKCQQAIELSSKIKYMQHLGELWCLKYKLMQRLNYPAQLIVDAKINACFYLKNCAPCCEDVEYDDIKISAEEIYTYIKAGQFALEGRA